MIALGIDSATRAGWGLVEKVPGREQLLDHGFLDLSGRSGKRAEVIEDFARRILARVDAIDLVGIEDNYLDTNEDKANVVTLKALARLAGRFEQAFEALGVETVLVNPQRWAVGILSGLISPRSTREARKAASTLWVRSTFKLVVGHDTADGVAIATYVARSKSFSRLAGQAG